MFVLPVSAATLTGISFWKLSFHLDRYQIFLYPCSLFTIFIGLNFKG